jgi:hypothetical protein
MESTMDPPPPTKIMGYKASIYRDILLMDGLMDENYWVYHYY